MSAVESEAMPEQTKHRRTARVFIEAVAGPHTGARWQFMQGSVSIGRNVDNDIVLDKDPAVSHTHLQLDADKGSWLVTDANSTNGTYLKLASERLRIKNTLDLHKGARIYLGSTALIIKW